MIEVTAICQCIECDEKFDMDHYWYKCENCWEEENKEEVKEAIRKICLDKHWEHRESFTGFKSEKEKDNFLKGVKYGIEHALFWIADDFDEIELWEELMEKDNK